MEDIGGILVTVEAVRISGEELLERPPVTFDDDDLGEAVAGRRILVTGAGGSVGSALTRLLAALRPAELTCLESHEPSLFHLRNRLLASHPDVACRWALADVRDERKLAAVFRECRPEVVFHLAAYKHVHVGEENVDQAIGVNVLGTVGLVRQAARAGVRAIVYPSTDKAVNPPSVYGATKRAVERYAALLAATGNATQLRVVRLVNVFGTQGSVVETFARQIVAGEPLTVTDPRMTRYWMTMREAVSLLGWAAGAERREGPYILKVGQPVPPEVTARRLARLLRPASEPTIRYVGSRPGERLHEELAYPYESLEPSPHPGVWTIRDLRGPSALNPDLEQQIRALGRSLYEADHRELRRRLFALAAGEAVATG